MKLNDIHKDSRGSINALVGEELTTCPEVTIFKTKKGYFRGGCLHPESAEHLCVVEGMIGYVYQKDGKLEYEILHAGQSFTIEKNIPHYFESITDSVVFEWGPKIFEKQGKHAEFRKIVMDNNDRKQE